MALIALTGNLHKQLDQSRWALLLLLVLTAAFSIVSLLTHHLTSVGICGLGVTQLISPRLILEGNPGREVVN